MILPQDAVVAEGTVVSAFGDDLSTGVAELRVIGRVSVVAKRPREQVRDAVASVAPVEPEEVQQDADRHPATEGNRRATPGTAVQSGTRDEDVHDQQTGDHRERVEHAAVVEQIERGHVENPEAAV